jgi:hypothetical protein
VVSQEQDIHAHHNHYQSKHVKRDGGGPSHRFIVRIGRSPDEVMDQCPVRATIRT